MSKQMNIDQLKHKRYSDIRSFFEKKAAGSPELVGYHKRGSTNKASSDEDSVTLDLTFEVKGIDCLPCVSGNNTPLTSDMKNTKAVLDNISKAVGDVLGVGSNDSPSRPSSSSYLTPEVTNTPISDAASLTGEWAMEDQVLLSSDNPELDNMTSIEVTEATDKNGQQVPYTGKFAVLGKNLMEEEGLQQRPKKKYTLSSNAAQKNTPSGAKRSLPFREEDVTPVKDGKGKKAAKRGGSGTNNPTVEEDEENMYTSSNNSSPPTVRKNNEQHHQNLDKDEKTEILEAIHKLAQQIANVKFDVEHHVKNQLHHDNEIMTRLLTVESFASQQTTISGVLQEKIKEHDSRLGFIQGKLSEILQRSLDLASRQSNVEDEWSYFKNNVVGQNYRNTEEKGEDCSFFLGGIQALREFYGNERADPAQVVRDLLYDTHSYCSLERLALADGMARQQNNRMQARAMIVVMRSPTHKKEALIRIKRYLSQNEIRDVSIGDCFSNDLMDKARALGRMGAAQRREGVIIKYRVMNRMGDAVMQTMKKGEPFKDAEVTEADLQPFSRAKPTVDTMEIDQQAGTSSQKGQPTGARPKQPPLPQPRSSQTTGANNQPIRKDDIGKRGGTDRPTPAVSQPGTAPIPDEQKKLLQQLEYWKKKAQNKSKPSGADHQREKAAAGGANSTGGRGRRSSSNRSARSADFASSNDELMDGANNRN